MRGVERAASPSMLPYPMTDRPDPPADETPIARALRLKKAAAKRTPVAGAPKPKAGVTPGLSKPWMKL